MKWIIYVFVRKDLSSSQQVVQTAHAVIESTKHSPYTWRHPTVIVFGIGKEVKLRKLSKEIEEKGIEIYRFHEPDRFNELTAFATECVNEEQKYIFERFMLLWEKNQN